MSGSVDVLAVMNKCHDALECGGLRHVLAEAIGAVAELIEAMESKVVDAEQSCFEDWLESKSPSGDHDEVQRKWLESSDYKDFYVEWSEQIFALARVRGAA
ncbi:hypothetical protein [Stenotrophomonas sp.]|uniref:hypothetical protein n=1 Tax=Stenotrophomonas sp. TaxID=69392 RepID=UPI002897E87B|nr:hypothetical protein [Stenotrophomonas sp.]